MTLSHMRSFSTISVITTPQTSKLNSNITEQRKKTSKYKKKNKNIQKKLQISNKKSNKFI